MKRLFFVTFLIFCFYFAASAQDKNEHKPIADPDIYGEISWAEEKKLITGLALTLKKDNDLAGFIVMYIDNKTTQDQLKERLENIIKHLTEDQKIEKNRFRLVVLSLDFEQTIYRVISKSEVPESMNFITFPKDYKFKQISDYFNKEKN